MSKTDAILIIGESPRANRERELFELKDLPVYLNVDEIPDASVLKNAT